MVKFDTYLIFNGNCREAIDFYADVLEKKADIMTFSQMPDNPNHPLPPETKDLILHASIRLDSGDLLMMSDNMPGMPFTVGNNSSISVTSKDEEEIRTLYRKLKDGGTITMELQETFWSPCFGMLSDKFHTNWILNYDDGRTY